MYNRNHASAMYIRDSCFLLFLFHSPIDRVNDAHESPFHSFPASHKR